MIPSGESFLANDKGLLIDGRNRAEAWHPFPQVPAINVKRRRTSKDQQARRKRSEAERSGEMLG